MRANSVVGGALRKATAGGKATVGIGFLFLSAAMAQSACGTRAEIVATLTGTPHSDEETSGASLGGADGTDTSGDGSGAASSVAGAAGAENAPPAQLPDGLLSLSGDLAVHDPMLVGQGNRFYVFHTGPGIGWKTSPDLEHWSDQGSIFEAPPEPVARLLPEVRDLWAPDVAHHKDIYHLYYAASTFGSGRSCIGHATKDRLDAPDPWVPRANVICSNVDDMVDYDAIDPSAFSDQDGRFWLVFGSYGSGIQLIELSEDGHKMNSSMVNIARRPDEVAIQGAHVHYRSPYYYLFATFDACCRGVESTSQLRVGRAETVEGPYVDRGGVAMLEGGGTLVLKGNDRYRAVGGSSVLSTQDRAFLAYHAYDANAAGQATLRISELTFDDEDWPMVTGP